MRKFNVTGLCVPDRHYMVNINEKLQRIMNLVHDGKYFTINRARQFGKTTTLSVLEKYLNSTTDYICVSITFENVDVPIFENSERFCQEFITQVVEALEYSNEDFATEWADESVKDFTMLGRHIRKHCKDKKIVLLVDEVDQASNNQVFLRFLGMLRSLFLKRADGKASTFLSVILAGVHDIKNIKLKLINAGLHTPQGEQEGQYNSPWNIATTFDVDMFFAPSEISTMLADYENDHHTGMDVSAMSEEIFRFTGGYPYLVSRFCQCMDEDLAPKDWTVSGVQKAVNIIAFEESILYDDMGKNLENNKDMYDFMYELLITGESKSFELLDPVVSRCHMFGLIVADSSKNAIISNKIFEMVLTSYFISKERRTTGVARHVCKGMYREITDTGRFDMELCLRKFANHYTETYASDDITFLEKHGRMIFLSFLTPLVNGHGFFHIESQYTDLRRMDVVVDYGQDQFIIELKRWKGEKAQDKAYEQLLNYMKSKQLNKGYLLTFDFRKAENKSPKAEWVQIGDNRIFEVII